MVIDPPSGWKYGFPKAITEDELNDLESYFRKHNYPEELMSLALTHSRYWNSDEE